MLEVRGKVAYVYVGDLDAVVLEVSDNPELVWGFSFYKYKYISNDMEERNCNMVRTLSNSKVFFVMAQTDAIAAVKKQYFLLLETHGERAGQL